MKLPLTLCAALVAATSLAAQELPRTIGDFPLYPGAVAYEDPYSEPFPGQELAQYRVAAAPEELVAWYLRALGSRPMEELSGPPSVKVGSFYGPRHDVVYWELSCIEDGWADDERVYEGAWIVEQLKKRRKPYGEGYIDSMSLFLVYRRASDEYVQLTLSLRDATFDRYMNGDPETGEGRGVKAYAPLTEFSIVEEVLEEM